MKSKTASESVALQSLSALAQVQRLRAFRALVTAGLEGLTPGAMAALLDIPASALSFHLKELTHAGLISPEPHGRFLIYRANFQQMNAVLDFLTEHCCGGEACEVKPSLRKKSERQC